MFFQLLGVVVFGVSIGGIANAQYMYSVNLFIVILVLTVFALVVSAVVFLVQKKDALRRAYDVARRKRTDVEANKPEEAAAAEVGADEDVKAMKKEASEGKADNKWADNYVPYGDYPDGHAKDTKPEEGEEKKDPVKE